MQAAGFYVHIPFCSARCGYCHFATSVGGDQDAYVRALLDEIDEMADRRDVQDLVFDTIYFGGGTPSLLRIDLFERLVARIRSRLRFEGEVELTVEANPEAEGGARVHAETYSACGVNRISLGVQSAVAEELRALDRAHSAADVDETCAAVRRSIANLNLDFIIGIPGQSGESLEISLELVRRIRPSHVSLYILEIFPGTKLSRRAPPDEDVVADLYAQACKTLAAFGYLHYEICNFALPGYECRHNLKYWDGSPYVGVGLGASSLLSGCRITNTTSLAAYVHSSPPPRSVVSLDPDALSREILFLQLRTARGLHPADFCRRFGYDPALRFRETWQELLSLGLVIEEAGRYRIPEERMLLGNEVFVRFLD